MNTIAITTADPVVPFTQNPKQPQPKQQTAKEAIAANVQALIEQLEQGHSEGLTAYLTAMGRFHNYSFGNILEIARQKPDATRAAGLYAWNQLGRKVRKGERGIRILAPVIGVRRKKDAEAEKDNAFVFQTVVRALKAIKGARQVIFVTHNPNIPVLGEAERVFVFSSDGQHSVLKQVGSVDECREQIENILEGGREAFLLRKERYGH